MTPSSPKAAGQTALSLGGATLLSLHPSMPGWGVVLIVLAGFTVAVLNAVLPQRSADRLAWWRDRRRHRERLHGRRAHPHVPARPQVKM